jgi:hypothetical protein
VWIGCELNGSGSCQVAGFSNSDDEHPGSATAVLCYKPIVTTAYQLRCTQLETKNSCQYIDN